MTDTPRVYVAILADYNNGRLTGEWIDAVDADDMRTEIERILRTSKYPNVEVQCPNCDGRGAQLGTHTNPQLTYVGYDKQPYKQCDTCAGSGKVSSAEEYAIHDYDGFYDLSHMLGEYPSLDNVARNARMIEEYGEPWTLWAGHLGEIHLREEDFQEAYCGQYDTEKDYTEELVDDAGMLADVDKTLAMYFDYDAYTRDLFIGDFTLLRTSSGEGHVFRDH